MKTAEEFLKDKWEVDYLHEIYNVSKDVIINLMEEYASQSQPQPVNMSEEVKNNSDNIGLLVDYTNYLQSEGYVDSDVYAETPTAIDGFLELSKMDKTHQPTKIDEGEIEEALDDFSSESMKEWDGYKDHRNKSAKAIAKLINGGTE